MTVRANAIRHRVSPGDVPADKAARRLHLTPEQFQQKLPELIARGFPPADPTTGMFDLDAIDLWRKSRFARLYGLTPLPVAPDAKPPATTMGERFRETKKRTGADHAA